MKRFFAMALMAVMICSCCAALAEEKKFDYSVLEGLEGYTYDKFERTWMYIGGYGGFTEKSGRYLFYSCICGKGW